LLLLSNSKNAGQGWLEHATPAVTDLLGDAVKKIVFVPFAGVSVSFDDYAGATRKRFREMGYDVESVHQVHDPVDAVRNAEAIAVGGGNTFHLLHHLYETKLIDPIRERATAGAPYIGWSAGSNVACPTIKTTNDMPIVQPPTFDAFDLVPFQLNPHYLDAHPEGHQGETREDRIHEFIVANPKVYVAGLREGSILRIEGAEIELLGSKSVRVFKHGQDTKEYQPGESLQFLLED
jgi:dipeptidase E